LSQKGEKSARKGGKPLSKMEGASSTESLWKGKKSGISGYLDIAKNNTKEVSTGKRKTRTLKRKIEVVGGEKDDA